jgi:hypothetical protein
VSKKSRHLFLAAASMKAVYTLWVAYVAIALMTIFSYVYSGIRKKKFKEPMLLNELAARLRWIPIHTISYHPMGWLVHYVVGVLFIVAYEIVREHTGVDLDFLSLVVAGAIFGIIGVAGWTIAFRIHPSPPPEIKLSEYYLQLVVAHIIFGIGAAAGYYSLSLVL